MKTILYLTDLYYKANGRNYYEEDLYVTSKLKDHFHLLIGHPHQALELINVADLIVFRNTGPVMQYKEYFNRFVAEVIQRNIHTFNSFDGRADMKGKEYLLQLIKVGYPVIPTIERIEDISILGNPDQYIVKLKDGADSIGMLKLTGSDLLGMDIKDQLIQPFINFKYEVSFYYLNDTFQYALYAPHKYNRWDLIEYTPTKSDLSFADKFIEWNGMTKGITRVDGCRLSDGRLLLVELEDLNPFLSIEALKEQDRESFIANFICALNETMPI